MIKSEIFSSFTLFISAADLASTLLITKWNILKRQIEPFIEFYMKEHAPDRFKTILCNHMLE